MNGEPMSHSHADTVFALQQEEKWSSIIKEKGLILLPVSFPPIEMPFSCRGTTTNYYHYFHHIRKVNITMALVKSLYAHGSHCPLVNKPVYLKSWTNLS